jgi:hypothetical protein
MWLFGDAKEANKPASRSTSCSKRAGWRFFDSTAGKANIAWSPMSSSPRQPI